MSPMADQAEIVAIGPADLEACVALLARRLPRWSRTRLADELGRTDRHWRAAREAGALIGLTGVWDAPDVAHLLAIAVDVTHEGQGLGARLLDDATRAACDRGRHAMTLEVRPGNLRAVQLYASHGFVEVGTRPGYFDGDDALLMTRGVA